MQHLFWTIRASVRTANYFGIALKQLSELKEVNKICKYNISIFSVTSLATLSPRWGVVTPASTLPWPRCPASHLIWGLIITPSLLCPVARRGQSRPAPALVTQGPGPGSWRPSLRGCRETLGPGTGHWTGSTPGHRAGWLTPFVIFCQYYSSESINSFSLKLYIARQKVLKRILTVQSWNKGIKTSSMPSIHKIYKYISGVNFRED